MADDFTIRGLQRFGKLSKDLREAGDKDLRKELYRGLQRATKPLKDAAKDSARSGEYIPRGGGLAERVARARYNTRARAGRNPSVKITAQDAKGRSVDLPALDAGTVRHPTFGRPPWKTQQVKPGWFTDAMEAGAPQAQRDVIAAIDAVITKFESKPPG